jgi:hypothetical protein
VATISWGVPDCPPASLSLSPLFPSIGCRMCMGRPTVQGPWPPAAQAVHELAHCRKNPAGMHNSLTGKGWLGRLGSELACENMRGARDGIRVPKILGWLCGICWRLFSFTFPPKQILGVKYTFSLELLYVSTTSWYVEL